MQTEKDKAEKYVRSKLPEVRITIYPAGDSNSFELVEDKGDHWIGIWEGTSRVRPIRKTTTYGTDEPEIKLNHWLRVLGMKEILSIGDGNMDAENFVVTTSGVAMNENGMHIMRFNLTTGQPSTEADYQAFNEITGNV